MVLFFKFVNECLFPKRFFKLYFLRILGVSRKNTAKKITIKVPISKNV